MEFHFREPPRSGEDVAKLDEVGKAYGENVIYEHFDFLVRRGERGPGGAR